VDPTCEPGGPAPAISVVIVNWNAGDAIIECLHSLADNAPSVPWEAVVVDNASDDGSPAAVRSAAPWARLIENAENVGLAVANNQGMAATTGDTILISNPDVIYRAGAVDALFDLLQRRPRAAFAFARLLHPDGTVQTCAGDLPRLSDALLGRQVARWRSRAQKASGFWWDGWAHDEERPIGHGGEACYLVRRAALADIGPQDPRYRLDWEGFDWSERAWAAGWECWFCPTAEVVHTGGVSIRQETSRWIVRSHRGMYRYFADRRPAWTRPLLGAAFGARAGLKLMAAATGAPLHELALRGRRLNRA
jgi:GT2 family glycosyltransferase